MSTSRRKQYHPNKFGARENVSPNGKEQIVDNNVKLKEVEETNENKEERSIIQPGTTFGPFPYSRCEKNETIDNDSVIELVDLLGQKHSYCFKDSLNYQWVQQLQLSANLSECNCVLRDDNRELKLTVTKPVESIKDFVVGLEVSKNVLNGHRQNIEATSPHSSDSMPILAPEKQSALTKNFMCNFCGTRFSNPRTLEAHQTFYCKLEDSIAGNHVDKKETTKITSDSSIISIDCSADVERANHDEPPATSVVDPSPASLLTNMANFMQSTSPPVILLPCAYTDHDIMQIIGYPQTVIPVAVSRGLKIPIRPLILEEQLMNGIQLTGDIVLIGNNSKKNGESDMFKLSLAVKASVDGNIMSPTPKLNSNTPPVQRPRSDTNNMKKVDKSLSPFRASPSYVQNVVKPRLPTPVPVPVSVSNEEILVPTNAVPVVPVTQMRVVANPPVSSASVSKPANIVAAKAFPCPNCGVTFSSEKTLNGHLSFYCTANKNQPKDPKITRKLIESQRLCCQFCDWTTTTTAELLQHSKLCHGSPNKSAYNCDLCGYRGHSLRGIKSHVKHAHQRRPGVQSNSKNQHDSSDADRKSQSSSSNASSPKSSLDPDYEEPDCKRRRATYPVVVAKRSPCESPSNQHIPYHQMDDQKFETNGQTDDNQRNRNVSNEEKCTSPTSLLKYKCKFCSYQSPYKGNVKRHVILIHKNDNASKATDE